MTRRTRTCEEPGGTAIRPDDPRGGDRCQGDRRDQEAGGASVLVLVLVAVMTTLALAGVTVGGVLVGQRRAAVAADLAALAAAEALGPGAGPTVAGVAACEAAGKVSAANDARMTGCLVEGVEVLVEVAVEVHGGFGARWTVPGRARAGPVRERPGPAP